jgi:hypothetical protein
MPEQKLPSYQGYENDLLLPFPLPFVVLSNHIEHGLPLIYPEYVNSRKKLFALFVMLTIMHIAVYCSINMEFSLLLKSLHTAN